MNLSKSFCAYIYKCRFGKRKRSSRNPDSMGQRMEEDRSKDFRAHYGHELLWNHSGLYNFYHLSFLGNCLWALSPEGQVPGMLTQTQRSRSSINHSRYQSSKWDQLQTTNSGVLNSSLPASLLLVMGFSPKGLFCRWFQVTEVTLLAFFSLSIQKAGNIFPVYQSQSGPLGAPGGLCLPVPVSGF